MDGEYLTIDEVADKLGLSGATVRRMVRNQEIAAIKVGQRQYRIPARGLAEYLAANTTERKLATPKPDLTRNGDQE